MIQRILALLPLFFLFSCVSTPEDLVLSEPPPSAAFPDGNGQAEIVVVRPGIMGFAVSFGIHVNGENLGSIRSNDYVQTLVDPGQVEVVAIAEAECKASFPVEADRSYYLLADPEMGWWYARVQLEVMDPEEGAEEREDCENQTIGAQEAEQE